MSFENGLRFDMNKAITEKFNTDIARGDPMNLYEYLASVPTIEDKHPFIQAIINSGIRKFIEYTYNYVPNLSDSDKALLKDSLDKGRDK